MARPKDTSKAGRKALPPERKKQNYTVTLIPAEAEELVKKYKSLTRAIRMLIISEPSETQALDTLKQVQSIINLTLDKK